MRMRGEITLDLNPLPSLGDTLILVGGCDPLFAPVNPSGAHRYPIIRALAECSERAASCDDYQACAHTPAVPAH